jgi:PEP-CTERM motif-containing protein
MKTYLRMLAKSFALFLAITAIFTLSQGVARADEVTISGFTTGVVTGVPQLTFAGNALFTGTTALGIGSLSGLNSLGTFHLSPDVTQLLNGGFTLTLTFTSPSGINGGQGTTHTATVQGSVSPNLNQGGVNIDFSNSPLVFTFNDGTNTGSFSLTLPDLFVQTGRSADLTAGITGEQHPTIPEPATLLLMGTGLTGIAAKLRKRKKAREEPPRPV